MWPPSSCAPSSPASSTSSSRRSAADGSEGPALRPCPLQPFPLRRFRLGPFPLSHVPTPAISAQSGRRFASHRRVRHVALAPGGVRRCNVEQRGAAGMGPDACGAGGRHGRRPSARVHAFAQPHAAYAPHPPQVYPSERACWHDRQGDAGWPTLLLFSRPAPLRGYSPPGSTSGAARQGCHEHAKDTYPTRPRCPTQHGIPNTPHARHHFRH